MEDAFVINLIDLEKTGKKHYQFELTREFIASAFDQTELQIKPGGVFECDAQLAGKELVVQGTIRVEVTLPCARCNGPLQEQWAIDVAQMLSPMPEATGLPEELELTPEELDREYFTGDHVAIDSVVRDALLLEIPLQPRHADGGCDPEVEAVLANPVTDAPSQKSSPFAALLDLKKRVRD